LVKWEKLDDHKIKLEVEVPEEEFEEALKKAYSKVVKEVNLPGFRKGKVPRKVLESRFGPEILYQDAADYILPQAYRSAIEEENIEPINEPEIEVQQIEKGKPFIFTAVVEVKPEVKLGLYRGVEVESEEEEIDEEAVDEHIEGLRQQHARMVDVEDKDREAAAEDLVLIDFCGYIDGEPFEGGEATDYSLEIGSNTFIPGFEEQLIGMKVDEEKEIKVTFPEDYRNEDLAGKEAVFQVTLKQIKQKELPELNDDFVKEISEFDNLEDFRVDKANKLRENAEQKARTALETAVIEKVSENAEVDVPETLVERQLDNMLQEMEQYLRYQGLDLEKFLQVTQKKEEDLREEQREEAEKRVKANLVLDAIIKEEGLEASEEELQEKIEELANQYGDSAERVRDVFEKQGRLDMIREEIRMRKLIDFLVDEAEVKVNKIRNKESDKENIEEGKEEGNEEESA